MRALTIRAALLAAISLAAALAGLDGLSAQTTANTDYADDNGFIEITNLAQLNAMRYDLDGDGMAADAKYSAAFPNAVAGMGCPMTGCVGYKLMNNLTFDTDGDQDVDANDEYPNWTPIGTQAAPFTAEFDGKGHSISRLMIRSGARDAGLFGGLKGAKIRWLNLLKADVRSSSDHPHSTVGALAGIAVGKELETDDVFDPAIIEDVYVTGRVVGTARHVGGLAGQVRARALIKSSCANATVASASSAQDARAGGLIGTVNSANPPEPADPAIPEGAANPANLFGVCALGDVYAVGARAKAGGLIGMATGDRVIIHAAYARGDVSATGERSTVGGLAGQSYAAKLEIRASYSTGAPAAPMNGKAGALIGSGSVAFHDSYWDSDTSGIPDDDDGDHNVDDTPEGRTTADLKAPVSETGIYARWQMLNLGSDPSCPSPWRFGTTSQYPVLSCGKLTEASQRVDYDSDNDGLIEITTLAQLDAMRYDLDGNGRASNAAKYKAAFRSAAANMGCSTTPCKGYELDYDITFDVNGDGVVDSKDPIPNWSPIGDVVNRFSTTFNGNGHAIRKMTIDSAAYRVGLFGSIGASGVVKGVGLLDADVTASTASSHAYVGALAGRNHGTIESSYTRGSLSAERANTVGGLVGGNNGWIAACWADVEVSSSGRLSRTGGFAGVNYHKIVASYSRGGVWGRTHRVGGFAGVVGIDTDAEVRASYSIGTPTGGGHVNGFVSLAFVLKTENSDVDHDSYWDSATSGTSSIGGLTGGTPKTTSELQNPVSATGIYANWQNLDLTNDGVSNAVDDPWIFGTASQYPVLIWGDLREEDQYADYDADGDALIEITTLAQLEAIRWDPDGDGMASDAAKYALAFPYAKTGMGCPSTGCDGYELARDLTFDTDGDGDVDAQDDYENWTPIGDAASPFTAEFAGNGYAVSKLTINSAAARVGLFGVISSDGSVKGVRLLDADVTSTGASASAGALAGEVAGTVEASYAGGAVESTGTGGNVGGLVGEASGTIRASWSDAAVSASGVGGNAGGLVGKVESGAITASHARGKVSATAANAKVGGLVGAISGAGSAVSVSYSTGKPTASGTGASAGGLVGSATGTTFTASYWDTTTSGVADDGDTSPPEGKTTSELQSPTEATGIYAVWNAVDVYWVFGTATQYPALVWGGLRADDQYKDYDADDDGLIEIKSLAQLEAVRHDLNGDGAPAKTGETAYRSAFPGAASDMGCPSDVGCVGYELDLKLKNGAKDLSIAARANWTPIANSASPFTATFEGNGQSISGLTISAWSTRMGLFGKLNGATIRNLKLKNVNISPTPTSPPTPRPVNSWTGALAGDIRGGSVSGVFVDGRINAAAGNIGGLAGRVFVDAVITSSCADVEVDSTFTSTTSTPGEPRAGGLIGAANAASVFASCALGDVSATGKAAKAGGLIGLATGTHVKIRAAYATGDVTANGEKSIASGLVGLSHAVALEITASYSTGPPTATNGTASGFARITIPTSGMATISDSYWDTTASRVSDDSDSNAPEGKTTTQLQSRIAATGLYGSWNAIDLADDGVADDAPWDFGTASQYPVIDWKGLEPKDQGR